MSLEMSQLMIVDEDSGFHDEHDLTHKQARLNYNELPLVSNTDSSEINRISNDTLVSLLNGQMSETKYVILDARYPYEFNGGHIQGACNVNDETSIQSILFNKNSNERAQFVIVHCEFSIKRGPSLLRQIREYDRNLNQDNYPHLHYPNLYLLDGGYKNFYELFKQFCEPQAYMPMLDDEHRKEMKSFRKKSKSWNCQSQENDHVRTSPKSKIRRLTRATSSKLKLDF